MVMTVRIELDQVALARAMQRLAPEEVHGRANAAMSESLALLQNVIQSKTPVNTGWTRGRIFTQQRGSPVEGWRGTVASPDEHMLVLEYGRKPGGRMPPVAAIERWAQLKLGKSGLGWAIARAIARRGTKPLKIFRSAVEQYNDRINMIWLRHFKDM